MAMSNLWRTLNSLSGSTFFEVLQPDANGGTMGVMEKINKGVTTLSGATFIGLLLSSGNDVITKGD